MNSYGFGFAQCFTGMAAMAFVNVDRCCFAVHQFVDLARTAFHAFATAVAFFFVNSDLPHIHHPFNKIEKTRDQTATPFRLPFPKKQRNMLSKWRQAFFNDKPYGLKINAEIIMDQDIP